MKWGWVGEEKKYHPRNRYTNLLFIYIWITIHYFIYYNRFTNLNTFKSNKSYKNIEIYISENEFK